MEKVDELIPELASRYLQFIGVLSWELDTRCIDISTEVVLISQYLAPPRLGHLEGLYHIFGYIRKDEMSKLVFETFQPKVYESLFVSGTMEWKYLCGYIKEDIPPGMLEPLVKIAHTACFVDDNHIGSVVTQHFHTGVLIYAINSPIIWFSKKQNIF